MMLRCMASISQSIWFHQLLALLMRAVLIVYGEYHDQHNSVHYTDVDYHVLTDAARYVCNGGSPYERHTYRYTPLLAWLMIPNVLYNMAIGKIIFCALDCVAAAIIYKTHLIHGQTKHSAVKCSLLWLYNPIVIGISTRGSAESVVVTVVLLVYYLCQQNKVILTGIFLGVAIHLKIYPIIYSLPIYLSLEEECGKNWWERFYPTTARLKLALAAVFSFVALTWTCYILYGFDYIQESYLYHVTRVDTRHNFSIYFYLLYLSTDYSISGLGVAMLAPQAALVLAYGVVYGRRQHLLLAMFAQTVVFVTFNKVITSQYFVWYLVFVPLLCCRLSLSWCKSILLVVLWVLAQAAWLLPAYLFEFRGINVFVPIWLESVAFFCCNVGVLMSTISSYWAFLAAQRTHKEKTN
uniref:GPI alpha-1,4-mannosyltransferase I, catalytic subunit n=1 Tax=Hirondellea gigas TaxID=1518452 RepID=A0A2P2HXA1_9CRUS